VNIALQSGTSVLWVGPPVLATLVQSSGRSTSYCLVGSRRRLPRIPHDFSTLAKATGLSFCLVLAACRPTAERSLDAESTTIKPSYIIVGDAPGAPAACGGTAIAARLSDLFRFVSLNDGHSAATMFGIDRPDVPFQWVSFTDTADVIQFTVRASVDTLANRFDTLDAADLTLRGIDILGWVPERKTVAFALFFDYMAPTSSSSERRHGFGKAEYHCPSGTFLVMSIGRKPKEVWDRLYKTHIGDL
jgi:hypothetical protein